MTDDLHGSGEAEHYEHFPDSRYPVDEVDLRELRQRRADLMLDIGCFIMETRSMVESAKEAHRIAPEATRDHYGLVVEQLQAFMDNLVQQLRTRSGMAEWARSDGTAPMGSFLSGGESK